MGNLILLAQELLKKIIMHEKNEIDMWLGKINKRQLDNNFNYKKKIFTILKPLKTWREAKNVQCLILYNCYHFCINY